MPKQENFIQPHTAELVFSDIGKDNRSRIQIMKTGTWQHPVYGEIKITKKDLALFKENFDKKVRRIDIGVDVEHAQYSGYIAWFKELEIEGNAMYAIVEWTDEGRELIESQKYRYFSPEFTFEYVDSEDPSKIHTNVLIGGGVTNRPFFKRLKPLLASDKSTDTQLIINTFNMPDDIKPNGDAPANPTPPVEPAAPVEPTEPKEPAEPATPAEPVEPATPAADAPKGDEPVTASEHIALSEEVKTLRETVKLNEVEKEVETYLFNDKDNTGSVLPVAKDKLKDLLLTLNEAQKTQLKEILANTVNADMFKTYGGTPKGSPNQDSKGIKNVELSDRATKLAKEEGISFEEAAIKLEKAA